MKSILFCVFIFTVTFSVAQESYDENKLFSSEELIDDFKLLRYQIETTHAGLYDYTPKVEMDQAFDEIESELNQAMTIVEFHRIVSPLLIKIANGHTELLLPRAYYELRKKVHKIFPFTVYYDGGKLFVLRNLSRDESISRGAEIKKINGEDAGVVFRKIASVQTRDGFNTTNPEAISSIRFSNYYADFIGMPERYDLELISPEGKERKVNVEALTRDTLLAIRNRRYGPPKKSFWRDNSQPALALEIEGNIATMDVNVFAKSIAKKRGPNFKKFFNDAFAEIEEKKVEHLIIDLRNNGGGDPNPTVQLFRHLHDEPFTFYRKWETSMKKIPNGKLYEENFFFVNIITFFRLKKNGDSYKVRSGKGLKKSKPAKDVFKGKVYVLTNPFSFSATGEMTGIIKEHNRAVFIGEEAGGNPNQNTSGMMPTFVLPNTQYRAVIPLILFEMNVNFENTGHGVIPDYPIKRTIKDILESKDPVMDFTLDLIKKQE